MIQPIEIKQEINQRPPFQRSSAARNYNGIKISWELEFYSIQEVYGDKTKVNISAIQKGTIYPDIRMTLDIEKYPEFNILHEGALIWVEGEISKVEDNGLSINLSNVEIKFKKEQKIASPHAIVNTFIESQVHLGNGDIIGRDKNTTTASEKTWYEKPIGVILLMIIGGVFVGFLLYKFGWV